MEFQKVKEEIKYICYAKLDDYIIDLLLVGQDYEAWLWHKNKNYKIKICSMPVANNLNIIFSYISKIIAEKILDYEATYGA